MKKNAIYPGTFDPITYGHIDVIRKSLKIVDTVVVAISDNKNKNYLFSSEERAEIIKKALVKQSKNKPETLGLKFCIYYSTLTLIKLLFPTCKT